MKLETYHALERTSPLGTPFIGRCTRCGKTGLEPRHVYIEDCPNTKGISEERALVQAIEGSEDEYER